MKKKIIIAVCILALILIGVFLTTGHFLPILLGSALVDSVNPCAFSVLILTITLLFSVGKKRPQILGAGASYIFGIFLTYVLIGLGILGALTLFGIPGFISKIVAFILAIFGIIEILDALIPHFPIKLKIPRATHPAIAHLIEKSSVPASFLLGVAVGLFEFPCTGGPYLFVLGLLHDKATYLNGFLYLVLYNVIFILPLVVVLIIASNRELFAKMEGLKKENGKITKLATGVIMVLLAGVIIFFS